MPARLVGVDRGEAGRVGPAADEGVAFRVEVDADAQAFAGGVAQVGGVNERRAVGGELGNDGVGARRPGRLVGVGGREVGGVGPTDHVGAARRVEGDVIAVIVVGTTQEGREVEGPETDVILGGGRGRLGGKEGGETEKGGSRPDDEHFFHRLLLGGGLGLAA